MRIVTERHKEVEEDVRKLRRQLDDLKRNVSDARKAGGYTKFAELLLQGIWPKIRFYNATMEQSDRDEITRLFENVEQEIENIKRQSDSAYFKKEE